jgi:hypothetical protein
MRLDDPDFVQKAVDMGRLIDAEGQSAEYPAAGEAQPSR